MSSESDERHDESCDKEVVPEQCSFFVTRKNRFCKMTVRKGETFCGEHRNQEMGKEDDLVIRVPCPLDSKHSCYAHLLKKHLKKCNARVTSVPDYIVKDINRGASSAEDYAKITLSSVEDSVLIDLVKKIRQSDVPAVTTEICNHEVLSGELNDDKYGESTRKHLVQSSSLLGHLLKLRVFEPETCFVEFGAGRGQLSYWIGEAMAQQGMPCVLVPIDRVSNRHKFDSRHRNEDLVDIVRLRVDIADLCLGRVPVVKDSGCVVAVCKHLCGVGTDLALRCLVGADLDNITGILMAPCCHHRVEWQTYVGQEYFLSHEFTRADFELMSCLASWATCGVSNFNRGSARSAERFSDLDLGPKEREEIGRKCKQLMDYGRLRYLEQYGYKCRMVYYTDKSTSPENVCLVAYNDPFSFF